ncbi:MAG: archaeosortase/exosortase family protein [Methanobacteriota archaeon]|nr:MAG: archaeosortase/exosortase family protein [Euryarchaeota archaeon]
MKRLMARLDKLISNMRRRRFLWLLIWTLIIFAGLDLLLVPPKNAGLETAILGLFFLILGLAFALLILVPKEKLRIETKEGSLATGLLNFLTIRGRLKPFFPVIGIALIVADILFNVFFSASPDILTHDTIVILFAVVMIAYNFIPERFDRERDFIFLFFAALITILVIPLMLARIFVGNFDEGVGLYSQYLLVPEVTGMLNLIGINAWVVPSVDPLTIHFITQTGSEVSVYISTACSGIYSFGIFASAFFSFILTEYNKIDRKVGLLLGLGILTAYFANILRMVIIVLVGFYTSTPQNELGYMLEDHSNAGWIIFLAWIGLFWFLMYRFLIRSKEPAGEVPVAKPGVKCGVCGDIMKVDIPGIRCECGQFLHTECAMEAGKCPKCGADFISQQSTISDQNPS